MVCKSLMVCKHLAKQTMEMKDLQIHFSKVSLTTLCCMKIYLGPITATPKQQSMVLRGQVA